MQNALAVGAHVYAMTLKGKGEEVCGGIGLVGKSREKPEVSKS